MGVDAVGVDFNIAAQRSDPSVGQGGAGVVWILIEYEWKRVRDGRAADSINGLEKGRVRVGRIQARGVGVQIRVRLVVCDAEAATDDGGPLSSRIPGKANSRRKVVVVGVPKLFHAADGSAGDLLKYIAPRAENHVTEEAVGLTGTCEYIPTQAKIHGEARCDLPIVLRKGGPPVPPEMAWSVGVLAVIRAAVVGVHGGLFEVG